MAIRQVATDAASDWVILLVPRGHPMIGSILASGAAGVRSLPDPDGPSFVSTPTQAIQVGLLTIEPTRRTVHWNTEPVRLSQREIDLLLVLCMRVGRAVSFRELVEVGWKVQAGIEHDVVHHAVKRMRRKLQRVGATVMIESVAGFGFRIDERVVDRSDPPRAAPASAPGTHAPRSGGA